VSDTIRVISIVGRFLEHSRLYYFRNGGDEELLMGSADLMPRNLDGRVETLFAIEHPRLRAALRDEVLSCLIADNVKARRLGPDGNYERLTPDDEPEVDCQERLLTSGGGWHIDDLAVPQRGSSSVKSIGINTRTRVLVDSAPTKNSEQKNGKRKNVSSYARFHPSP